jgi:hypothetical protein
MQRKHPVQWWRFVTAGKKPKMLLDDVAGGITLLMSCGGAT